MAPVLLKHLPVWVFLAPIHRKVDLSDWEQNVQKCTLRPQQHNVEIKINVESFPFSNIFPFLKSHYTFDKA